MFHDFLVNAHLEQVDVCLLLEVCGQIQHGSHEGQQAIAHCAQAYTKYMISRRKKPIRSELELDTGSDRTRVSQQCFFFGKDRSGQCITQGKGITIPYDFSRI